MRRLRIALSQFTGALLSWIGSAAAAESPPEPAREFRGVWISTVHNVDWPSRTGLPEASQKAELVRILDRCVELRLNAIMLQVRSECDSLYESDLEPWSPWLTGTMGQSPGYDPLAFALEEAHARGLELHAWFNPFRAVNSAHGRISRDHVSKTHASATSRYGEKVWLDPALPFSRERALRVIEDVLRRYDIDAVHLDDYFYPYPVKVGSTYRDFDDARSWEAYRRDGGKLSRADWRRDHVNQFVSAVHALVRKTKPSCKFGISPFGIYRPGQPVQVRQSLDSYDQLYADVRLWMHQGWLDYVAPQLYWETSDPQYGFAGLCDWWCRENIRERHVWPGIAIYRIQTEGRTALDPVRQVNLCRAALAKEDAPAPTGHVLFSVQTLMDNPSNVAGLLRSKVYQDNALVPACDWLREASGELPAAGSPTWGPAPEGEGPWILRWKASPEDRAKVRWWLVQTRTGTTWRMLRPVPADASSLDLPSRPDQAVIRAVGRSGILGVPVRFEASTPPGES
jgi:uncharacterized lipoprotein YddW (UPF0748 family)